MATFGDAVAVFDGPSGDGYAAIGASSGAGAVYTFKRSGGSWNIAPDEILASPDLGAFPDNTAEQPRMVGVAIAVFDEAGRLVGVASGGSKLLPLKPERQKTYTLLFSHVNGGMHAAKTFRITLESR